MTRPRSIHIFLADGDPDGTRVAQLSMSTIQAIAFRRTKLKEARQTFSGELQRPGTYILIGADEDELGRRAAYVGESEDLGARLAVHTQSSAKGFWTDTIVLLSKDENLTKSHARYLEACLIRLAARNARWTMPNAQTPSQNAGKLPLADIAAMDEFVEQAKILVAALGCDLIRTPPKSEADGAGADSAASSATQRTDTPPYRLEGEGFAATMELSPSGEFIVKRGSFARLQDAPSLPKGLVALRASLRDKGVLSPEDGRLRFTSDYAFASASSSAAAVAGMSINGRAAWKAPDGRSYALIEAEQSRADEGLSPNDGD